MSRYFWSREGGPSCLLLLSLLMIPVVFGVIIGVFGGGSSVSSGSSRNTNTPTMACIMSQDFVSDRLKSPSTAQFPSPHAPECRAVQSGNIWIVRSYVDAENSFGAVMRTIYIAELEFGFDGNTWKLIDIAIAGQ